MKNMLIMTDFSESAFRASEYGCELAGSLGIKRILLYHAYQAAIAFANPTGVPLVNNDDQEVYLQSMEELSLLQDRLRSMTGKGIEIDLVAEDSGLTGMAWQVNEQTRKEEIGIIVMGASGKSGLDKFLLGSTTTQLLQKGECPVLIVPEDVLLGKGINTIVLTTDLSEIDKLPVLHLHELLDALPAKLQVVNVKSKGKERNSPKQEKAIADLEEILKNYDPGFNYVNGDNVVEEIIGFAREQQA
ncbi:MAG TPA: universal stress protein, partial [Chitinophagaceae bacterium]|nr:universal stress protein [Chitinophagaceae bacterium]